jgi:hypothetical protein
VVNERLFAIEGVHQWIHGCSHCGVLSKWAPIGTFCRGNFSASGFAVRKTFCCAR